MNIFVGAVMYVCQGTNQWESHGDAANAHVQQKQPGQEEVETSIQSGGAAPQQHGEAETKCPLNKQRTLAKGSRLQEVGHGGRSYNIRIYIKTVHVGGCALPVAYIDAYTEILCKWNAKKERHPNARRCQTRFLAYHCGRAATNIRENAPSHPP